MTIESKDDIKLGMKVKVVNMNLKPKDRKNPIKGEVISRTDTLFNVHNGKYQESFAFRDMDLEKGIVVTLLKESTR